MVLRGPSGNVLLVAFASSLSSGVRLPDDQGRDSSYLIHALERGLRAAQNSLVPDQQTLEAVPNGFGHDSVWANYMEA